MKYVLVVFAFLSLISCGKEADDDVTSGSIYYYKASCQIHTSGGDEALCVEYLLGYDEYDMSSDCMNKENDFRNAGYDIDNSSIFDDTENAEACLTNNVSGKCVLNKHQIFFYTSEFSSGEAQTECNTLGGTLE